MIETFLDRPVEDNGWRGSCEQLFREKLTPGSNEWAAYVIDGPDGVPVCSVVGWVIEHVPGPKNTSHRRGYIASMSTAPALRKKGYGRAVFAALMEWFDTIGVQEISLLASHMGEPLYAEFGFRVSTAKAMTWRRPP